MENAEQNQTETRPPRTVDSASVKVMRSYDYCHFEINLSGDGPITLFQVDLMRKEAARLADKAVEQYKVAKKAFDLLGRLRVPAYEIKRALETPESERTLSDKAILKFNEDAAFRARLSYDYEDDWEEPDFD